MRPRYSTEGIVLARSPLAEASALLFILTLEFGLVRARAQGVRKPGAKLAPALQTLAAAEVMLVHGKDGWRLSGAVLGKNWFGTLSSEARVRAARVSRLILRLVPGETKDPAIYEIFTAFLEALSTLPESEGDAAECVVVLRLLAVLGLDAGTVPTGETEFAASVLKAVSEDRQHFITRINRGIAASGL